MADSQGCQQGRQGLCQAVAEVWVSCHSYSTGMGMAEWIMLDACQKH